MIKPTKQYPNNSDTIGTQLNDAIAVLDKELSYYEDQRAENLITHEVFVEHLSRIEGGMKAFLFAKKCCDLRMKDYMTRTENATNSLKSGLITTDEHSKMTHCFDTLINELSPLEKEMPINVK